MCHKITFYILKCFLWIYQVRPITYVLQFVNVTCMCWAILTYKGTTTLDLGEWSFSCVFFFFDSISIFFKRKLYSSGILAHTFISLLYHFLLCNWHNSGCKEIYEYPFYCKSLIVSEVKLVLPVNFDVTEKWSNLVHSFLWLRGSVTLIQSLS